MQPVVGSHVKQSQGVSSRMIPAAWHCKVLKKNRSVGIFVSGKQSMASLDCAEFSHGKVYATGRDFLGEQVTYEVKDLPLGAIALLQEGSGWVVLIDFEDQIQNQVRVSVLLTKGVS